MKIRTAAVLLLAAGCLAPPKIHSWQIPQSSILVEANRWAPLSTNLYVRVDEGKRSQGESARPKVSDGEGKRSTIFPTLPAR